MFRDEEVLTLYTPVPEIGFEAWNNINTKFINTNDTSTNLKYEYLKANVDMFSDEFKQRAQNGEEDIVLVKWTKGSLDGILNLQGNNYDKTCLLIYKYPKNLKILDLILESFIFLQ